MKKLKIWVSNRHIHLSQEDASVLFGEWYQLNKIKDLTQPGQFAANECVTIKWPKGQFDWVRILWPYRNDTQVEIMIGDNFKLWINAPIRLSGDLENTPWLEIIWPQWFVIIEKWVIVAKRHIHMNLDEAQEFWLEDWQVVSVKVDGERWLIFENVIVRADIKWSLDMHIDMEEANAAGVKNWQEVEIL